VAEQTTDAVETTDDGTGIAVHPAAHEEEHNPGRPISWAGTSIVIIGFVIGGISMIPGPHWIVFWIGVAVVVIGGLVLLSAKTMNEDWY
jgi:hypothetical protein